MYRLLSKHKLCYREREEEEALARARKQLDEVKAPPAVAPPAVDAMNERLKERMRAQQQRKQMAVSFLYIFIIEF